ncbi:hypothetical protein B0H16DRAFT_1558092 [Mycena metata]|uniref:Uncharacterized protein n=1 Tax=Mycena metata TaxID=1033252 RepID=A0AAD7ILD5_9AGAR|nr:hypothetical protein B0H16DRAFT_1558092 [Mycena metata]
MNENDDLAADIRALTTLLSRVAKQATQPTSVDNLDEPQADKDARRSFHHVAVLLSGSAVLGVTGSSSSGSFTLFGAREWSSPPSTDSKFAPLATCNPQRTESDTRIKLSHTDDVRPLAEIFQDSNRIVPLSQHILDVTLYPTLDESDRERARMHILRRSFTKFSRSLYQPGKFFNLAASENRWWTLLENIRVDDISAENPPVRCHVRSVGRWAWNILARGLVPSTGEVSLTATTMKRVLETVVKVLQRIHEKVGKTKEEKSWEGTTLDDLLLTLSSLLYGSKIIQLALSNASISNMLLASRKSEELVPDDDEDDLSAQRDGPFIYRSIEAVVAWHRAIGVLAASPVLSRRIPISFQLITAPPPPADLTPFFKLIDEASPSIPAELRTELEKRFVDEGLMTDAGESLDFPGSTHCEAILMGFMLESNTEDPSPIRHTSNVIGVTKKCCYCCDKLAAILNASSRFQGSIKTPGSHGFITPWSPPAGIPDKVLLELRNDLMGHLRKFVSLRSNHRSPSSEEGPDTLELTEEDMKLLDSHVHLTEL